MLIETISYTDYNGVPRTKKCYFNLSKAEVMEMELSISGGLSEMIDRITEAQDAPTLFRVFKDMILKAYGEKSPDGDRFMKSEEISTAFSQTEAFSELLMSLVENSEKAAKFFNGIFPVDLEEHLSKIASNSNT